MTENQSTSSDNCPNDSDSVPIVASFKCSYSHCIFCAKECPPTFVIERGKLQRVKEEMELNSFGCDNVILTKQLRVINIMKNILDIRQETCQKFLGEFDGQFNPEFWVKVCVSCKVFVEEFNATRREIARLQKKASQLKEKLKGFILTSNQDEELEVGSIVWREIRDEVLTGLEHPPPEPPTREDEQQFDIHMEVDVEPELRVKTEPPEEPRSWSRMKRTPTVKAKQPAAVGKKRKTGGTGRKRKSGKGDKKPTTTEGNGESEANSVELNSQPEVENSWSIFEEQNGISGTNQKPIAMTLSNNVTPIKVESETTNATADVNLVAGTGRIGSLPSPSKQSPSTSEDNIENLPEQTQSTSEESSENIGNEYLAFLEETSHSRRLSWLGSSNNNSEAFPDENNDDVSNHPGETASRDTDNVNTPTPNEEPILKFRVSLKTALSEPVSSSPSNIVPPWEEEDRLVRESLQSSQSIPPSNPSQVEREIPAELPIPLQIPQVEVETHTESPMPPTQNLPRVVREIPVQLSITPLNPPPIHVEIAPESSIPPQNRPQVETETLAAAVSSNNSINVHGIDDFLANLLNPATPPPPSTPARAVPVSKNNNGLIKCDKCPATLKKTTIKYHRSLHNGPAGVACPLCWIYVHKSRVACHQRSEKCLKPQPPALKPPVGPVETVERNNSNPTAAELLRRDFFYFKNGEYVPNGFTRLMGPLSAAIYQCKACPAKVKKGQVLVHEALHKSAGEDWSSVCSHCGLFIRTDELFKHEESECSKKESCEQKRVEDSNEPDVNLNQDDYYKCKDCYALLKPGELKQHLQLHETGSSSRNICIYCGWLVADMDSHRSRWHSERGVLKDNAWALGPNFWVVDGCNPNYILFEQEYVSKFQCKKCPTEFLSMEEVEEHAKQCESSTTKKRRVSTSTSATNASNGSNFGDKFWNCDKCNARCLKEKRQEHKELHESGNGVTCDMCGLMLKAEALVPHLLYFHP